MLKKILLAPLEASFDWDARLFDRLLLPLGFASNGLRSISVLLLLVILLLTILPLTILAQADKIYERVNQAVVVVTTYDAKNKPIALGSGFFVRPDGALVTNLHVVSKAVSIKVKISKDKQLDVEGLLYCDDQNDLVILKVNGNGLPTVPLGDSDSLKPGEKVYAIGSPSGLENTISDGIVSGIRTVGKNKKVIQITAPISSGNSGGPVFNEQGEVIGVSTFIILGSGNLNFAMPINLIKDKINSKDITKISALAKSAIPDVTNSSGYLIQQGNMLFSQKKYKEALESFKKSVAIKADSEEGYCALGACYFFLKDYQNALKFCKKAVEIKADYVEGHRTLGWIYRATGYSNEAIYSFNTVIKLEPDDGRAYLGMGMVYIDKEDYPVALSNLKKASALTIDNEDDMLELYKAMGYAYEMVKNFSESIKAYKRAVTLRIDDIDAALLLGRAYLWAHNYYNATDSFKKVLKITSLDGETCILTHYLLGLTYVATGNSKDNAKSCVQNIQGLKNLKGANVSKLQKDTAQILTFAIDNPQKVWDLIYQFKLTWK
ncbi:MAG: trypsin-like peptidase domain-containing protein [Planctomycetota bacterium]